MAHMNIQAPLFGRSGQAPSTDGWGDVDQFDVDMLAEYLLDDGNLGGGITFDFGVEDTNQNSGVVSPENSEDGVMPPIAEMFPTSVQSMPGTVSHQVQIQAPIPGMFQSSYPCVPLAPAPTVSTMFPSLPDPVPNLNGNHVSAADAQNMIFYQHDNATKRRRVQTAISPMIEQSVRGKKKSQAQIDRRRERNRILAKRTRLRKKFFFESLQKEVMDLQRENIELKDIVKVNIKPEISEKILDECKAMEKLPESVLEACGADGQLNSQDFNLVTSIQKSQHSFIITDPSLQDNPIVFASDDFLNMTGYSREQVLGRNCRFLQGTETSKDKVDEIRKSIANGEDVSVTLINYTADGTPFWNKLFIASLRDAQDNVVNYIGVTVRVAQPEPGDPEHGKELPISKSSASGIDTAEDTVRAIEGAVTKAVAASM